MSVLIIQLRGYILCARVFRWVGHIHPLSHRLVTSTYWIVSLVLVLLIVFELMAILVFPLTVPITVFILMILSCLVMILRCSTVCLILTLLLQMRMVHRSNHPKCIELPVLGLKRWDYG